MYAVTLFLHSYTRWLVLIAMGYALVMVWSGRLHHREWGKWEQRAGLIFATTISIQFILGVILVFAPMGLAQAAWRDMGNAMKIRELQFFGLEHPLQMTIALALVHLGQIRARKVTSTQQKYRWATICFTIAALLILTAVPWQRPLLRVWPAF